MFGERMMVFIEEFQRRRVSICLFVLGSMGLGITYAVYAPKTYLAEVTFLPASAPHNVNGLGQLSGLASLAGINLGSTDGAAENIALLRSSAFLADFAKTKALLPVIFAEDWDVQTQAWKMSDSDERSHDIRDVVKTLKERVVTISENKKQGTFTIGITWRDASSSAAWANELVAHANMLARARARDESTARINYLREQLRSSDLAIVQSGISAILEAELNKAMLIDVNEDYAFRIVDPAVEPKEHHRPRRVLIVFAFTVLGSIVALSWLGVCARRRLEWNSAD